MTEPRFSEEEFAEILRRATEMQARLPSRGAGPGSGSELVQAQGMSLAEIQGIAGEVGIDPALVARAASLVSQEAALETTRGDRWVLKGSLPGTLSDEDRVRVLRAIRDASAMHGDADTSGAGVEWKAGDVAKTLVSVESLDGRNEVRVSVDASAVAILSHFFPMLAGLLLSVGIGEGTGVGLVGGLGILGTGLGSSYLIGRGIWSRVRHRSLEQSRRILAAVTGALPVAALGSAEPLEPGEPGEPPHHD